MADYINVLREKQQACKHYAEAMDQTSALLITKSEFSDNLEMLLNRMDKDYKSMKELFGYEEQVLPSDAEHEQHVKMLEDTIKEFNNSVFLIFQKLGNIFTQLSRDTDQIVRRAETDGGLDKSDPLA